LNLKYLFFAWSIALQGCAPVPSSTVGALLTFLQTKVQADIPGREQSVYSAVKKLGSLVMLALQEIEV
jgi:hypothetical protein